MSLFNFAISATQKVLPIIILVIYIMMMVGVAYYFRLRKTNLNEFLLAGRGLNGWMSAFAYGTTYFSAVIFIGYAGKFGWGFGLASVWIGISNALIGTFLAWKVLASRTRALTRNLNARTLPEFFEKRYQTPKIRIISSIIIFIFLIPYSASVYQGLAYLFEGMFGIDFWVCVSIMAVVTALYLFFGGYMATALTDFMQGVIMLFGVIVMALVIFGKAEWGAGLQNLTENGFGIIASTRSASGGFIDSPMFTVIILCLLTSFGMWGLPQSIHKFYTIRNDGAIKKGSVISTLFAAIVGGGAYFVGSFVRILVQQSEIPLTSTGSLNFDAVIPIMLNNNLPSFLMGLIMVLVLSASMSTLAAVSLSSSSAIAMDLYKGVFNEKAEDKKVKLLLKILCIVFVCVSALLAVAKIQAIVYFMSLSWGTLAGCFIGPYVLGLYSKKITKQGAWASIISGLTITFTLLIVFGCISTPDGTSFGKIIIAGIGRSPHIGVIAMICSLIITPLVSAFTKAPSSEVTDLVGKIAFEDIPKATATVVSFDENGNKESTVVAIA
jgi:SSS family transporter